jgi:hypothetical protein
VGDIVSCCKVDVARTAAKVGPVGCSYRFVAFLVAVTNILGVALLLPTFRTDTTKRFKLLFLHTGGILLLNQTVSPSR